MSKEEIVLCVTEYIEIQLKCEGGALSLDEVAKSIGYSKFYLNRIFQEKMAVTIHQYILERRLSEAAWKLIHTNKALVDIAYEAGYQSQQAFTNAFSNIYLCPPMKFRFNNQYLSNRKAKQLNYRFQSCTYPNLRMGAAA